MEPIIHKSKESGSVPVAMFCYVFAMILLRFAVLCLAMFGCAWPVFGTCQDLCLVFGLH